MKITSKSDYKEWIEYERKIYNISTLEKFLPIKIKETQILWDFMMTLRKTEFHVSAGNKMRATLYKIKLNRLRNKYGLHIPVHVVGKGFSIAHLGPIVINGGCVIGNDCRIHVGVNIGANRDGGTPTLGNGIYIGPGAKIFGEIEIADGICIGANAVVNKTFTEKGITLVGVPARKVKDRIME